MKQNQTIEHINTLSYLPESGRWVATTASYQGRGKTKRKLLLSTLLLGALFYFYNPMTSYQPQVMHTDAIALNTVQVMPQ